MPGLSILVVQHLALEHAGSLRGFMDADGHRWRAVDLGGGDALPSPNGWDALIVLGGPMQVWEVGAHPWLATEQAFIRDWVRAGRPYLGICLGHQLLAAALGGSVDLMTAAEIGLFEVALTVSGQADPVLGPAAPLANCLQWHHAAVTRPPPGAVVLADNAACPVQAMRVGSRAWGVQFHPEVDASTAADWGAVPDYAADLDAALGPEGRQQFEAACRAGLPHFEATAQRLYTAFTAQAAMARMLA